MKGLAISNSPLIREAHNSLTRCVHLTLHESFRSSRLCSSPADLRGARNALATNSLNALKANKPRNTKPTSPKKTRKPITTKTDTKKENTEESYHFIGYVPAFGKVWELVSSFTQLWRMFG
jgi:ubiquitin carboxyl-terminal hydrolase L5